MEKRSMNRAAGNEEKKQMQIEETNVAVQSTDKQIVQLQKVIESLKSERQDIAVLGDGEVFIRRSESGAIKAVSGVITLTEEAGQIVDIQGKSMITAVGYNSMNKIAGVSIITPKTLVMPNGQVVVNPYPILDNRGGIAKIWVKKLAIGYSPTGNLAITSSTLLYDIKGYFLADMIKKIKYNKNAGKIIPIEMKEEYWGSLNFDEKLVTKIFDFDDEVCVVVDFRDKDANTCFETYSESKKFAERKAQTIAERNALKKHPAFSQVYVSALGEKGKTYSKVRVVGWISDLTSEDLQRLAEQAEQGEKVTINGVDVIVQDADVVDTVGEEDFEASPEDEEIIPGKDDVQELKEVPVGEEHKESDEKAKVQQLLSDIKRGIEILGDEKAAAIIKTNLNTTLDKITKPAQLAIVLKLINTEIDKGVEASL